MTYASGYDHDVFVSYAHLDNDSESQGRARWVSLLVDKLQDELQTRLGVRDIDVWMDYRLLGNEPLTDQILDAVDRSATLLIVMSPGYINSQWCEKERSRFLEAAKDRVAKGSVFIVYALKMDNNEIPQEFKDLLGYRFWLRDGELNITLGKHDPRDSRFLTEVSRLADDLKKHLKGINAGDGPSPRSADTDQRDDVRSKRSEDIVPDSGTRKSDSRRSEPPGSGSTLFRYICLLTGLVCVFGAVALFLAFDDKLNDGVGVVLILATVILGIVLVMSGALQSQVSVSGMKFFGGKGQAGGAIASFVVLLAAFGTSSGTIIKLFSDSDEGEPTPATAIGPRDKPATEDTKDRSIQSFRQDLVVYADKVGSCPLKLNGKMSVTLKMQDQETEIEPTNVVGCKAEFDLSNASKNRYAVVTVSTPGYRLGKPGQEYKLSAEPIVIELVADPFDQDVLVRYKKRCPRDLEKRSKVVLTIHGMRPSETPRVVELNKCRATFKNIPARFREDDVNFLIQIRESRLYETRRSSRYRFSDDGKPVQINLVHKKCKPNNSRAAGTCDCGKGGCTMKPVEQS